MKYQIPEGFLYDENSGLYYTQFIADHEEGAACQFVTWFDADSGEYTQYTYPIESKESINTQISEESTYGMPMEEQTSFRQNADAQLLSAPEEPEVDLSEYYINLEEGDRRSDRKMTSNRRSTKQIAIAGAVLAVVILAVCAWKFQWLDKDGNAEKAEVMQEADGDEAEEAQADQPMKLAAESDSQMSEEELALARQGTQYPMDNIYVNIIPKNEREAEFIKIGGLSNMTGEFFNDFEADRSGHCVYEWEVELANCSVSLSYFYEPEDSKTITAQDMQCNLWIRDGDSSQVVDGINYDIAEDSITFYNVILPDECTSDIKTIYEEKVNVNVLLGGTSSQIDIYPIVDFAENFPGTEEYEKAMIEMEANGWTESKCQPGFAYYGTFTCFDSQLAGYEPYIDLGPDGTFYMRMNLGDTMADATGTYTWEEKDDIYIFLYFDDVGGTIPSEATAIMSSGPDTLYFETSGFGLMGYGDSSGYFSR